MRSVAYAIEICRTRGIGALLRSVARYPVKMVYASLFALCRGGWAPREGGEKALDFTFNGCCGLLWPLQRRSEIARFITVIDALRPHAMLEIGTANGATLFLLARAAADDARVISIDLPGGAFGGGYPAWRIPFYRALARRGQSIRLIRADSHAPAALAKLRGILAGAMLDALFIDGDHTYEGVRQDFAMYAPLVRRGGVIGFHDIAPNPGERGSGVHRFWEEIRVRYRHEEYIDNPAQRGFGIGVLYVD